MSIRSILGSHDDSTSSMPKLALSGSETSVSSMLSTVSSSNSFDSTESSSSEAPRRRIFSKYWQKNQALPSGISALVRDREQPRSPLIQHYPSRSVGSSSNNSSKTTEHTSPTSTILPHDLLPRDTTKAVLSVSPRRSIFGTASSSLAVPSPHDPPALTDETDDLPDLDKFFSEHEHMTVLSSSLDSTGSSGFRWPRNRRARSNSCLDPRTTRAQYQQQPLASCLKQRRRRNSDSTLLHETTKTVRNDLACLDLTIEKAPSVTFDSQVEIVAFQPVTASFYESCSTEGSWTDLFER